jgi:sigma-B regulation protein RsbU (phosphoserine phosphatase)
LDIDLRRPWLKWLLLFPYLAIFGLEFVRESVAAVSAQAAGSIPEVPVPQGIATALMMCIIGCFFVSLSAKFSRGTDADDKRRLKLLYYGCTVAMTPMFLMFLRDEIFLHREPGDADGIWLAFCILAMFLFPLTMGYVIVVQQAMPVRMVIRQGVQYALAKQGVAALEVIVICGVILVAFNMVGSANVQAPWRIVLVALAVALVVLVRRNAQGLQRWVDRRFFREAYDAEQILGELSEQVRGILDRDSLLHTVAMKLSESLHVERIAVMLQQGSGFRPALATGYASTPDVTFPDEAETVSRLRTSREPVRVRADESQMPESEALHRLDAQLLLPLATRKELLGFISLGPKRSEEPYSASDTRLLRTVAAQTGMALENSRLSEAIASEVAQRELLNREIEIAREVQQRLFPQNLPEVPALEYAGHCRPARGVGGDYYDFLALSNGRLGLAIGDVSGKGVPAALLMASLQASVRGQSQALGRVADLMSNVNRLVCDASPENRYATFFYGEFDPTTRKLVYTNGGHNPPMLFRGDQVLRLENGGPPVGLFRPARYEQDEIGLEPGDLLVFFTDGISEAENPAEEEWGEEALVAAVRSCETSLPTEMISQILHAADAFAAGAPQHDDMTLVVARCLMK